MFTIMLMCIATGLLLPIGLELITDRDLLLTQIHVGYAAELVVAGSLLLTIKLASVEAIKGAIDRIGRDTELEHRQALRTVALTVTSIVLLLAVGRNIWEDTRLWLALVVVFALLALLLILQIMNVKAAYRLWNSTQPSMAKSRWSLRHVLDLAPQVPADEQGENDEQQ